MDTGGPRRNGSATFDSGGRCRVRTLSAGHAPTDPGLAPEGSWDPLAGLLAAVLGERPSFPFRASDDRLGSLVSATRPTPGLSYVPYPQLAPPSGNQTITVGDDLGSLGLAPGKGFPGSDLVKAAAALLPLDLRPRRTSAVRTKIEVAPAVVRIRRDWGPKKFVDRDPPPPRGTVIAWSPRSRSRMILTLASLDYEPMFVSGRSPAMLTATLPGDWLRVCPDGPTFKRFWKRFLDAIDQMWGNLPLAWKLEFQARGAPHGHAFLCEPYGTALCRCRVCRGENRQGNQVGFREWCSHRWAAIVNAPDPEEYRRHLAAGTAVDYREGLRASDPKRLAVYFSKHGAAGGGKEYQHVVPLEWQNSEGFRVNSDGEILGEYSGGPGRFWGYRHLEPVWGTADVPEHLAVIAARTIRRYSRHRSFRFPGEKYPHRVERGRQRMTSGAGYITVNDGPAFVSQLARYLNQLDPKPHGWIRQERTI